VSNQLHALGHVTLGERVHNTCISTEECSLSLISDGICMLLMFLQHITSV
jgi:hypothetical protein